MVQMGHSILQQKVVWILCERE